MPTYRLAELAEHVGATFQGSADTVITGIATIQNASADQITFLDNTKYQKYLSTTGAGAVIMRPEFADESPTAAILTPNPYYAYAKIAKLFERQSQQAEGIHPSATVASTADIHPSASIGPNCVIGESVIIGANVILAPSCVIGDNCQIGADSRFHANVTLYHGISIGQRCLLHSGVVIGADGFGIANEQGAWHRVPQLGGVRIGDDVDVGANTCIDRGAIEDTIIDSGVKIDNLVQIGHNAKIGSHTAIAGCTGISGSVTIGKHCLIGGGAGIVGHIQITDHTCISGMSGVSNSITEPGVYSSGLYPMPAIAWRRNAVRFKQLDSLFQKVKKLERVVASRSKEGEGVL